MKAKRRETGGTPWPDLHNECWVACIGLKSREFKNKIIIAKVAWGATESEAISNAFKMGHHGAHAMKLEHFNLIPDEKRSFIPPPREIKYPKAARTTYSGDMDEFRASREADARMDGVEKRMAMSRERERAFRMQYDRIKAAYYAGHNLWWLNESTKKKFDAFRPTPNIVFAHECEAGKTKVKDGGKWRPLQTDGDFDRAFRLIEEAENHNWDHQ